MTSRTDVANLIFAQLEMAPVENIDATESPKCDQLRATWDLVLRWTLAQHPWKFARGWWWRNQPPLPAEQNPSAVYATAYARPADCCRVVAVGPSAAGPRASGPFTVEGDCICTDVVSRQTPSGTIDINGVRYTVDPGKWSIEFVWYFAFQMAWVNGKALNASEALRERAKQDADKALADCRSLDAMQGDMPQLWPDTWLDARNGPPWEQ